MSHAYEDIGPRDDQVLAVAWRDPENLRPVVQGTFSTWFVASGKPHGVAFVDAETAERAEGDDDDVFGFLWLDDNGAGQRSYFGKVRPWWAEGPIPQQWWRT